LGRTDEDSLPVVEEMPIGNRSTIEPALVSGLIRGPGSYPMSVRIPRSPHTWSSVVYSMALRYLQGIAAGT